MPDMKGYSWPLSAAVGEGIDFFASTTSETYSVTYIKFKNNNGEVNDQVIHEGNELIEIPISNTFNLPGKYQNENHTPAEGASDWIICFSLVVPVEWPSGIYTAKCVDESESLFYIPFIIKPNPAHQNPLLVLANCNTWNAYNPEFGYSRYAGPPNEVQLELSFLRPYTTMFNPGETDTNFNSAGQYGFTSKHQLRGELWVVNWLAGSGYHADVVTDIDLHAGIEGLANYSALIITTHPEYWTIQMYGNLENYLGQGGKLLYLGGNGIFDAVDISADLKVMTVFGGVFTRNRLFTQLGLPESRLLGVATPLMAGSTNNTLQANGNNFPERCEYRAEPPPLFQDTHRFFDRTGLQPGDVFGKRGWYLATGQQTPLSIENSGASGGEVDRTDSNSPANIQILATGQNPGPHAEMTYYDHPGGGFVFSAGSITFGGSLIIDKPLQQMIYNIIDESLGWLDPSCTRYAAIWEKSDNVPFRAYHGIDRNTFQFTYDELRTQGYRLINWSGYEVQGEDRYSAVWKQAASLPWEGDYLMTTELYQINFEARITQGYRLTQVFGYALEGQALYGSIWVMQPGPGWQARHGLTADEYQATFDQLISEGYCLAYVNAFAIGNQDIYSAIWELRDAPLFEAHHGLTSTQYQQKFDKLLNQGFRLIHVCGYTIGNEARYAAIWEFRDGPEWEARHGLTASEYQRTFNQMLEKGYKPIVVCGY